ncbi:MAG: LacI family transcriptional regulator [Opitutus sp.]|nr:LacI family transcriptional regulator [Opitutus sp.]
MPPITIRDVADRARVSIATVSKSLANKPDVSAATRERILGLCRELGYKPNPLVSALMRHRRRHSTPATGLTLAYVTAFPTPAGWRSHPSPIFRQMFDGAQARAEERNYRIEHFWLYRDGMSNQRFSDMLHARGIRGILFAPVPDTRVSIELAWSAFSVVGLGLTPTTSVFHRVSTDYYQSMLLALEECRRAGYRRPGFTVRLETVKRLEFRWEAAFLVAHSRRDVRSFPQPLVVDEWTPKILESWLVKERPDVVLGPVLGELEALLRASGRRIPDDIGLVGLIVPTAGDRLSGILQHGEIIGAAAVDQLISQIERDEKGRPEHPMTHTMLGTWNPGTTIRHDDAVAGTAS